MIVFPNAKINLGLSVVSKREDGYHDLETIFLPILGLHDILDVEKSDTLSFQQTGIVVDCPPEKNLILRAYHATRELFPDKVSPVAIRFCKQIPFGAGLGGGSADAAFMVRVLNDLFGLGMTFRQMEELVSPLGADCAFFIQNRPQFATGIGNEFSEVAPELLDRFRHHHIVLVKPECAVSTAQAYRGIVPRGNKPFDLTNDFEATVFPLFPEIAAIKQQLLDMGADYAAMSGSGATVFGLFSTSISTTSHPDLSILFPGCFIHQQPLF